MRYTLLLVATASLLFANTAKAGLGWTLEECKNHYGEPIGTRSHALGLMEYVFSVKDFIVHVETDQKGKVGYIAYSRSSIDDDLVTQLMQQNAPKATWEIGSSPQPNGKVWLGSENGTNEYLAMLIKNTPILAGTKGGTTKGDAFTIGTYEFSLFEDASKEQEAKDAASGL